MCHTHARTHARLGDSSAQKKNPNRHNFFFHGSVLVIIPPTTTNRGKLFLACVSVSICIWVNSIRVGTLTSRESRTFLQSECVRMSECWLGREPFRSILLMRSIDRSIIRFVSVRECASRRAVRCGVAWFRRFRFRGSVVFVFVVVFVVVALGISSVVTHAL